jgi:hypothetical protein
MRLPSRSRFRTGWRVRARCSTRASWLRRPIACSIRFGCRRPFLRRRICAAVGSHRDGRAQRRGRRSRRRRCDGVAQVAGRHRGIECCGLVQPHRSVRPRHCHGHHQGADRGRLAAKPAQARGRERTRGRRRILRAGQIGHRLGQRNGRCLIAGNAHQAVRPSRRRRRVWRGTLHVTILRPGRHAPLSKRRLRKNTDCFNDLGKAPQPQAVASDSAAPSLPPSVWCLESSVLPGDSGGALMAEGPRGELYYLGVISAQQGRRVALATTVTTKRSLATALYPSFDFILAEARKLGYAR